jgi:ribulose-5-phosphate 4-epimerase/fuculose-1-phosphate aldolase
MTDEKGYIQFHCEWEPADPPAVPGDLIAWRDRLHRLGLIGVYPNGISYGNISTLTEGGSFLITGTATGHLPTLGPEHFAEVTAFDFASNWLRCRGPVKASSESLSHAAVYVSDPTARAVIHVHHLGMWEQLRDRIPTADHVAEAGTPEMAWAIESLLRQPGVKESGFFVMGGHREGLIAFGATLDEAGERIVAALDAFTSSPPPA